MIQSPNTSSNADTPEFHDKALARRKEFQLQVDVANVYQTHLAPRDIRNREWTQWEHLAAAPGTLLNFYCGQVPRVCCCQDVTHYKIGQAHQYSQ